MSIVVVVVIVPIANDVVNAGNVLGFHGCPSNLHKCPHPFVDAPQPLKSWHHALL
jgi:hypothetical protein